MHRDHLDLEHTTLRLECFESPDLIDSLNISMLLAHLQQWVESHTTDDQRHIIHLIEDIKYVVMSSVSQIFDSNCTKSIPCHLSMKFPRFGRAAT